MPVLSKSRAKGTFAETALVRYLVEHGWLHAERRALHGTHDRGDVTGTPGVCWECKSATRLDLPGWLRETAREKRNDRAAVGVLVVKPHGIGATRVEDWAAVMPLSDLVTLLHAAGYGDA